jgi:hypothetical protein
LELSAEIKRGVKAIPRKSAEIVLDFDATDDPLHMVITVTCRSTHFCGNIPLFA